jgi:molybdopterin-guanine dinucleotide biosynthesis protein
MSNLTQAGTPEYWWLEGDDTLHAWPGDGASLTVFYTADSPALAAPTDTPLIPARYHPLWIDYAVVEAYKDSDNFAAAQALRSDIAYRLQDVIARYETRNRQHSSFMTVRDFHEDD